MQELPNYETLKDLITKIDQDFDLPSRLTRYKTMAPELVRRGVSLGLTNEEDTSRALFVSDFIITASEVPAGGTDDERHESVIQTFLSGITHRGASSDTLMRIYYLAYKLAIIIRRQDLFMAGRGLARETALLRLMDTHVTSYLAVCAELLGNGSCGWELGVLSAALKRTYPHTEIQNLRNAPKSTDRAALIPFLWPLLTAYADIQPVEVNPNLVITNIKTSKGMLVLDSKKTLMTGLWNCAHPEFSSKADRAALTPFVDFLKKIDVERQLLYFRGRLLGTEDHFFFVRNPFVGSNPFLLLQTTADEINVSELLPILQLRGLDYAGWLGINADESPSVKTPVSKQPKRGGLLGRLKRILGGKPPNDRAPSKPLVAKKPILAGFLAHAITVDAVGDIKLFERFDVERESEYAVEGAFESNFAHQNTVFLTEKSLGDPVNIVTLLDGLDDVLETVANHFFGGTHQILPEEILFTTKEQQRTMMVLAGSVDEQRIVGTIASTYLQAPTAGQAKTGDHLLKRRSLLMRTNQLLTARRTTQEPFDTVVERIYGGDLDPKVSHSYTVDHSILHFE